MKRALVLDGRSLSSLAVVRSLGSSGYEVHVGDTFRSNLTSFSRYVDERVVYPDPEDDEKEFVAILLNRLQSQEYDVVIPTRDATTRILAAHQDDIDRFSNTYLADPSTLELYMDKGETIKLAAEVGVPTPSTYFPEESSLEQIKQKVSYPALVRPRRSAGSRGIERVESARELEEAFRTVETEYGTPMIQEFVEKTGYTTACVLLDDDQEEIASFSYERIKEYPLSGGPTVVGRSTHDTEAKRYANELMAARDWRGVAEVEFILDEEGTPRLLEVNPRFWMPVQLPIEAGVDFPNMVAGLADGEQPEPVISYNTGVTYRWILPYEILHTVSSQNLLDGLGDMVRSPFENTSYGVLSWNDPLVTLGTVAQSLAFLLRAKNRRAVIGRGW